MNIKVFVDRPFLSIVISVMIVTIGIISLLNLSVEKYPDIAPTTINVWASYPGASAETVQKTVVAPLEEAINGVENMTYMTSEASNGAGSITIFFVQGTNADMAAVNIQNRVAQAQAILPSEVIRSGVITQKKQPGQLRTIALESPNNTYDEKFLSNYFYNNIQQAILRIHGVGKVEVFGSQYALRIWLKPDVMALRKIVPSDITTVLEEQNTEASIGEIGANSDNVYQYTLHYTGRKVSLVEFENIVVTSKKTGEELLLKDVADVELGLNDYSYCNQVNGHNGVMGLVYQTFGSNATKINQEIDLLIKDLEKTLPKDIKIVTFDNTNDFLFAAINEVVITLVIAFLLVLVVVYLFIQDIKATIIPAIGIIVSLIGTFAFMQVAGFSINLLTLFALVLVIGTVVDDSIVVVEAVKARLDTGYSDSRNASIDAINGLMPSLFSTTLVFMVIFIPVSFMGGTTGIFYKQFGLTMAVAVGISFVNAISLSVSLCVLLFKPVSNKKGFSMLVRDVYLTGFYALLNKYTNGIKYFIDHRKKTLACVAVAFAVFIGLIYCVPTGFIPDEDTGAINIDVAAPAGYTQQKTEKILKRISDQVTQIEGVQDVGSVVGFSSYGSGGCYGMCFVQLKPWDERKGRSVDNVLEEINNIISAEHEANVMAMTPGMVDGYGNSGGFEFSILNKNGADITTFYNVCENFIAKLNENPAISEAYSGYNVNYPQYAVDVNASKCKKKNVSPSDVLKEMSAFLGSEYVSNINMYNNVYQVVMQLRPEDRANIKQLDQIFVRSSDGEMLPIGQFVSLSKEYRPQVLNAFNKVNSIGVSGTVANGASSGDAIRIIQETASSYLPTGYEIEYSGITREEIKSGNNVLYIFSISLFFTYLVMVALYESLFIPLAIMFSIPFGIAGAYLFALLFGVDNNIYFPIGLIMLIGLLCKTSILLTEYATQCRDAGMTLVKSALFSAKVRFRPILMTSLTMIIGMLPLMFASGVGANGSRTIGVGTVGGMLIGCCGILFVTPVLFIIFQTIQEKMMPNRKLNDTIDPLILKEMENLNN